LPNMRLLCNTSTDGLSFVGKKWHTNILLICAKGNSTFFFIFTVNVKFRYANIVFVFASRSFSLMY
jgi:hypothetical protein